MQIVPICLSHYYDSGTWHTVGVQSTISEWLCWITTHEVHIELEAALSSSLPSSWDLGDSDLSMVFLGHLPFDSLFRHWSLDCFEQTFICQLISKLFRVPHSEIRTLHITTPTVSLTKSQKWKFPFSVSSGWVFTKETFCGCIGEHVVSKI